jgi:Ala-tRNA(Pro) deacylase
MKEVKPIDQVEKTVLKALGDLGISYRLMHHEPAMTMDDLAAVDRELGADHPKNLFLCNRQQTTFYLLLLAGHKAFRTASVSKQLGVARLSFAGPELLWKHLQTKPGGISPLGLMFDAVNHVQLLVDRDLQNCEKLSFHPCVNTTSLVMTGRDFFGTFLQSTGHTPNWVTIESDESIT